MDKRFSFIKWPICFRFFEIENRVRCRISKKATIERSGPKRSNIINGLPLWDVDRRKSNFQITIDEWLWRFSRTKTGAIVRRLGLYNQKLNHDRDWWRWVYCHDSKICTIFFCNVSPREKKGYTHSEFSFCEKLRASLLCAQILKTNCEKADYTLKSKSG